MTEKPEKIDADTAKKLAKFLLNALELEENSTGAFENSDPVLKTYGTKQPANTTTCQLLSELKRTTDDQLYVDYFKYNDGVVLSGMTFALMKRAIIMTLLHELMKPGTDATKILARNFGKQIVEYANRDIVGILAEALKDMDDYEDTGLIDFFQNYVPDEWLAQNKDKLDMDD